MKIAILGAGAFGTSLAQSYARTAQVWLWARRAEQAQMMQNRHENPRLPDISLDPNIQITNDLTTAVKDAALILLAIPLQQVDGFLAEHSGLMRNAFVVNSAKGIDQQHFNGGWTILKQHLDPDRIAILTGPSFAADIARGKPTALVLAGTGPDVAQWQSALTAPHLRIYQSADPVGAELGGALKNVIAIACGAAIGAGLGESARAAIMTRGFAEMTRFAQDRGAAAETLSGLSGFGDLALTCSSDLSRNFRYGLSLGRGQAFDTAVTVEGRATALALAQTNPDDMPILSAVAALSQDRISLADTLHSLLSRPLKKEF